MIEGFAVGLTSTFSGDVTTGATAGTMGASWLGSGTALMATGLDLIRLILLLSAVGTSVAMGIAVLGATTGFSWLALVFCLLLFWVLLVLSSPLGFGDVRSFFT